MAASETSSTDLTHAEILWKSADALRAAHCARTVEPVYDCTR